MMSLEIICGVSYRVPNRLAKARSFVAGASDRAAPNILPDKILHHGGATRADPNENEHTPLVWKPAHPLLRFAIMASVRSKRILRCSAGPQKRLKPNRRKENFFSICFVLIQPRSVCFSRAMDVLPFCRLIQLTRPVRLSNAQNKITGAAARLHRGVTR